MDIHFVNDHSGTLSADGINRLVHIYDLRHFVSAFISIFLVWFTSFLQADQGFVRIRLRLFCRGLFRPGETENEFELIERNIKEMKNKTMI